MTMLFRRLQRNDLGAAAIVEMALVAPLVLILLFGVIDLGRLLVTAISVSEATQEGALYAAYFPDAPDDIKERIVESADSPSIAITNISIECPSGVNGPDIRVTVSRDVSLLTPFAGTIFPDPASVTSSVTADILVVSPCSPSP